MLEWIDSHGLLVSALLTVLGWLFSMIVGMLPTADELKTVRPNTDPLFLLFYAKALPMLQVCAANAARLSPSFRITSYLKKNGGSENKP